MAEEETKGQITEDKDEVMEEVKEDKKGDVKEAAVEETKDDEKQEKQNGDDAEEEEEEEKEQHQEEEEEEEEESDEKEENNDVKEDKKEEEEDDNEEEEKESKKDEKVTPKKEPGVPLYDQPLETSGKRDRKKVERFVQETKKEEVDINGIGTPLGEIPFIDANLTKMPLEELKVLHRVAFNRPGSGVEIKKNLRKFNGYPYSKDDKKYQSKQATVERLKISDLKKILKVLGLERSGIKEELVERVMNFMLKPENTKKSKQRGNAQESGKSPRGRGRKTGERKQNSSSASVDDSGSTSSDNSNDEDEDEEEEEEGKSKKAAKRRSKGTPRRRGGGAGRGGSGRGRGGAGRGRGAKRARPTPDSDDDSESDDEPLAKKAAKQPPSDAELKVMVKKILEGANLEEVTMKSVCRQVYDSYPDFDLTHKKTFIKETVKSIIS